MTVYRLTTFPEEASKFIFDTNVLIYLHGFTGTYKSATYKNAMSDYSKIANNIIVDNSEVYLDLVALSEFINVYINEALAYKLSKDPKTFRFNKKALRGIQEYKDVVSDLEVVLDQIMTSYNITIFKDGYDNFNVGEIPQKLLMMEFNDYLICLATKRSGSVLVTNDRDIVSNCSDIQVITALPA